MPGIKLPRTEAELLEAGEWVKRLVLAYGAEPETAFMVAAAWVAGLREIMEKEVELHENYAWDM